MYHDEYHNERHRDEMDKPGTFVAAHQSSQSLKLHRLPNRKSGQHQRNNDADNADISGALHGIVDADFMLDPATQRIFEFTPYRCRGQGQ